MRFHYNLLQSWSPSTLQYLQENNSLSTQEKYCRRWWHNERKQRTETHVNESGLESQIVLNPPPTQKKMFPAKWDKFLQMSLSSVNSTALVARNNWRNSQSMTQCLSLPSVHWHSDTTHHVYTWQTSAHTTTTTKLVCTWKAIVIRAVLSSDTVGWETGKASGL